MLKHITVNGGKMLEVKSPQTTYFEKAKKYKKAYNSVFLSSIAITLIFTFLEQNHIIKIISIISLFSLLTLDYLMKHYFSLGEDIRRNDHLDNSLGTNYSHESSENYYDTDEVDKGLYKMITNTFESALFSVKISERMKHKMIIKILPLSILIIGLSLYGFSRTNYAIPILQLFLSKIFIIDFINIWIYHDRVSKIFNDIKKLFDQKLVNTSESIDRYTPEIIKLYMEYETNISKMKVSLDSKVYSEINKELTEEWEKIKVKYKIG